MKWIIKNKVNKSEVLVEPDNERLSSGIHKISCNDRNSKEMVVSEIEFKKNQRFISMRKKKDTKNNLALEQNYRWRSNSIFKSIDDSNTYIAIECQGLFKESLIASCSLTLDSYYEGMENRISSSSQQKSVLKSPITGKVLKVLASLGSSVKKGEVLFIIEAMKMENRIVAPNDAHIKSIKIQEGSNVQNGQILGELENK